MTTTDFQEWLAVADPEGYEEVYSLYRSVKDTTSFGLYDVTKAKGDDEGWIVSAKHVDEKLLLASNKAKEAFLNHIEKTYCDGELEMEGWYAYKHGMSKND